MLLIDQRKAHIGNEDNEGTPAPTEQRFNNSKPSERIKDRDRKGNDKGGPLATVVLILTSPWRLFHDRLLSAPPAALSPHERLSNNLGFRDVLNPNEMPPIIVVSMNVAVVWNESREKRIALD